MPEGIKENTFFKGHLRRVIDVLHGAAPARARSHPEVRALGSRAHKGLAVNFKDPPDFKRRLIAKTLVGHLFPG